VLHCKKKRQSSDPSGQDRAMAARSRDKT
jgi:hypothetical protein